MQEPEVKLHMRGVSSPGGKGYMGNNTPEPKKKAKGLDPVPVQDLTENRRVIIESSFVGDPLIAAPKSRVGRVVRIKVLSPKLLFTKKGDIRYKHKVVVDFEPMRDDGTWSGAVYTRKINFGTLIQPIGAAV